MIEISKLKNFFSLKSLLIFFCLIALLFIIPSSTSADICVGGRCVNIDNPFASTIDAMKGVFNVLINIGTLLRFGMPIAIYTGIAFIIATLMALLSSALGVFLGWFINATLSIAVVPGPDTVEVVNAGWRFSRDFANLFFILILAFIGLATILRIRSYELQKILPRLIIIALLVNFSGVLVGLIVDISNLITGFFVSKITTFDLAFGALSVLLNQAMAGIAKVLTNITENPVAYIGLLIVPAVQMTVIALFFAALAVILFLILFMFIARVAILWILTILAPLAFLAYILPATRSWWDKWWSSLIGWSIIGIPMTFFLYLSSLVITNMDDMSKTFGAGPDGLEGALTQLLVPIVALLFLIVGFMISVQIAPEGAQAILKYGKKFGKWGGASLGTAAWRRIGGPIGKFGENIRKRGQGIEMKGEEATRMERIAGATLGRLPGTLTNSRIANWGARIAGTGIETGAKHLNMLTASHDNPEIEKARKDAQNTNSEDMITKMIEWSALGDAAPMNSFLGTMMGVGDNGDTDDIIKAVDDGRLNWNMLARVYETAKNRGTPFRRHIEKMFYPYIHDIKDEEGNIIEQNRLGVSPKHQLEIGEKFEPQEIVKKLLDVKKLDPTTERGRTALEALMLAQGATLMPALSRVSNRETRKHISEHLGSMDPQWFIDNNVEDILIWANSSSAQALGIKGIGDLDTPQKVTNFINEKKFYKSNEKLREDVEKYRLTVAEVNAHEKEGSMAKGEVKRRTQAQKDISRIEKELGLRAMTVEELEDTRKKTDEELISLTGARTSGEISEDEFLLKREEYRENLKDFTRTIERKTVKAAKAERPITVQLVELEEKAAAMKVRAGGKIGSAIRTTTGVSIPSAGMQHEPGRRAKGELKKLQAQIKELKKRQGEQSPIMRVWEDVILQDQTRIDTKVSTIAVAEKSVVALDTSQKQISADLEALSGKPASSQRVNGLKREVQEIQRKRDAIIEQVAKLEEELKQDRDRITEETKRWEELRQRPTPQRTDVELLQSNLTTTIQEETTQKTLLATLKTQKVSPEEIAVAQKKLDEVRRRRKRWKQRVEDLATAQSKSRKKPARPPTGGPPTRPASPEPRTRPPGTPSTSGGTPSGPRTGPATRGGTPPTSGGTPSATSTSPTPSASVQSTPQQESSPRSAGNATTPLTPPDTPQPSQQPQRPRWLGKGLDDIKTKKGVPATITRRLRQYLKENGVQNSEIKKMTPLQAWQRADELSQ